MTCISSCRMSLMPYCQTIEAAVVKTLKLSTLPVVTIALVCKCAQEWIKLRQICPLQFLEGVATQVCIRGHDFIQVKFNSSMM